MVQYNITKTDIDSIPFDSHFQELVKCDTTISPDVFFNTAGKESYRLLSYLSAQFNHSKLIHIGASVRPSLALSYNPTNHVIWFNLDRNVSPLLDIVPNIELHTLNIFDDEEQDTWKHEILNAPFIFFDVPPHLGTIEYMFYEFLKKENYQGFILYDNVWFFENLRNKLWYKIPDEYRYDITDIGHWTGSCIVSLNPDITFPKYDIHNWTLVTAYYNLTKCPDASQEIKNRDLNYYLSHSLGCLSLPHNMVIYCDPESYDEIYKIRPAWLRHKTHYVIGEFDDLHFTKNGVKNPDTFADYRNKINQNRRENPYHFDSRNTASYYLFCMSRYMILKETIIENPFGSTHFCWINLCIQRMGFRNLIRLDEALAVNRDKFSTTYIDYVPKWLVEDYQEYFKFGRCSLCSGFFTGNFEYMYRFCELMEDQFLYYMERKCGHSDETLMSPAYFKQPELVEWYVGDYFQMITNYKYVYDAPEAPIRNFIRNSFQYGDYERCFTAVKQVWNSFLLGKCDLSKEDETTLTHYLVECKKRLKLLEL
jgi:hypothetical protein